MMRLAWVLTLLSIPVFSQVTTAPFSGSAYAVNQSYYVDSITPGNNANSGLSKALAWADFTNIASVPAASRVYTKLAGGTWVDAMLAFDSTTTVLTFEFFGKTGTVMHWNFGDGSTADINNPNHTYANGNRKTVRVASLDGLSGVTWIWKSSGNIGGVGPFYGVDRLTGLGGGLGVDLNGGAFAGALPNMTGSASIARVLWSGNQFTGTIANYLPNTSMRYLYLDNNQLTGSIPAFGNMNEFMVGMNSLTGSIPSFAAATSLTLFDADNNFLSGTIPSFSASTALGTFKVFVNNLSGTLPSFPVGSLQLFYVTHNDLSGTLPSFAGATALKVFEVYGNRFSGTVPDFSTCTALTNVWFGYGQAVGRIYTDATDLIGYVGQKADANGSNLFTDVVAGSFATQKNLVDVGFQNNALSASAVNQILADLVVSLGISGRLAASVRLEGGTNAAPTGQGLTDKANLISHGWGVTTN